MPNEGGFETRPYKNHQCSAALWPRFGVRLLICDCPAGWGRITPPAGLPSRVFCHRDRRDDAYPI